MSVAKTPIIQEVEEALRQDLERRAAKGSSTSPELLRKRAEKVGTILRYAGGASLTAAGVVLLFQQWDGMDHVWRYLSFLIFTFAVGAAGVFCGTRIKESKGARQLLAFIPALACIHGAQLGALIYSIYGTPRNDYPALLLWQASSGPAAWGCVAAGVAVLVPLLFLAYSALDRRFPVIATLGCLAVNGALLIPLRDSGSTAVIAGFMTAIFVGIDLATQKTFKAHTKESRLAVWSLSLPLFVLVGRQMFLYGVSTTFVAAIFAVFAVLIATKAPMKSNPTLGIASYYLSLFMGSISWMLLLIDMGFFRHLPTFAWMAFGFPIALGSFGLGLLHEKAEKHFETIAAIILVGASCFDLMRTGTSLNAALQLLCALSVLTWACLQERRLLLFVAGIGVATGLYEHVIRAIFTLSLSPWLVLGTAGILTIVGGSYLEKNFVHIQNKLRRTRKVVGEWEM